MKKYFIYMVALMTAFTVMPIFAAPANPIWSGKSGGFEFQWTTDTLQVTPANDPSTILYSAKQRFQKEYGPPNKKWRIPGYALQYLRMVSLVGTLMSIEQYTESFSQGAAHPFNQSRFTTIDMRHPDRKTTLTDYFNAKDVYHALLQDKIVRTLLKDNTPAPTLSGLVEQLGSSADSDHCEWGFEPDILTRFAFYDVKENKVAVRLGLDAAFGVCRGSFAQLGIWLPIPEKLRQDLNDAASQTSGFLMKDRDITKPIYSNMYNPTKTFLQNVTHFEAGDTAHIQDYR